MQLTKDQITQLYSFTRQHFVEWYDLQTELVDHLANDIESILEDNPNLTFHEAKGRAFSKFGIFGFHDVITEKSKSLNKKYWKLVWHFLKDFFRLPKIILTLSLSFFVFSILNLPFIHRIELWSIMLIYLIIPFIISLIYQRKLKKHQKITGKKWLFEQVTYSLGGASLLFQLPLQMVINSVRFETISIYSKIGFSLFFVLSGFFFYIAIKIIPKKMEDEMVKEFPDYQSLLKA